MLIALFLYGLVLHSITLCQTVTVKKACFNLAWSDQKSERVTDGGESS